MQSFNPVCNCCWNRSNISHQQWTPRDLGFANFTKAIWRSISDLANCEWYVNSVKFEKWLPQWEVPGACNEHGSFLVQGCFVGSLLSWVLIQMVNPHCFADPRKKKYSPVATFVKVETSVFYALKFVQSGCVILEKSRGIFIMAARKRPHQVGVSRWKDYKMWKLDEILAGCNWGR